MSKEMLFTEDGGVNVDVIPKRREVMTIEEYEHYLEMKYNFINKQRYEKEYIPKALSYKHSPPTNAWEDLE